MTDSRADSPTEPFLATPGPSNVPEPVRAAMAKPLIHHRSGEFSALLGDVLERARAPFGTERDVMILTSSGTGGMQAVIENLTRPGDEIVVCSFGRFGQRWADIGTAMGRTVHHWEGAWGERPQASEMAAFAAAHSNTKLVLTTHSETSTGTVSDAAAIAAALREAVPEALIGIDAISSAAALRFHMDAWGYDAVVSGSQKAWMLPPGLAYVVLSDRAETAARELRTGDGPHPFYFDLCKALDRQRDAVTTPWTPAHGLIIGMQAALDLIDAEGLDARDARHRRHGRAVRAAVAAMGVELFSPDHDSSGILTAIEAPDGIAADQIRHHMRDVAGIFTAGGQAQLKGRIVRIGHTGWFTEAQLLATVSGLAAALNAAGHPADAGAGLAAASTELIRTDVPTAV